MELCNTNTKYGLTIYKKFISNEKFYSKKFSCFFNLNNNKNFNESEYKHLKPFFKDEKFITQLIYEIEIILQKQKFNIDAKYLVLGDFFFSMFSHSTEDPAYLIFKNTRNKYIKNLNLRFHINKNISDIWTRETHLLIHQKLLIGLVDKNLLQKDTIRLNANDNWECIVYYTCKLTKKESNFFNLPIGYSYEPFEIIEISGTKYSISSFRNVWPAKRKKREMEEIDLPYDSVEKANKIGLELDKGLYNLLAETIENEKTQILKKTNFKNIDEYYSGLRQVLNDKKYTWKLFYNKETMENVNRKETVKLTFDIKKEQIEILRLFQKINNLSLLERDIFGKKLYLPCFMDNRGRIYYSTQISPTYYKIFRYLYKFSQEKEFSNLENSTFYKKIIFYKNTVKKFKLTDFENYILIIFLIEVGKNFIPDDKQNFMVKTEQIILIGLENYEIKNVNLKFDDTMYVLKIYALIDSLLSSKPLDINSIIFKDATSSGLQNYGILLGYKKKKLKYLNLDGDDWCDTYQYLIKKFLKTDKKFLFKRSYWKKTIMTIPYNARWISCYKFFLKTLKKQNNSFKYSNIDKCEMKNIHQNFYNNIEKNLKNEFYLNKQNTLKEFKYYEWVVTEKKEYKVNYKKKRDKYVFKVYDLKEDTKTSQRGLEANNMHYLDAKLVKYILNDFEVITIHDCFGIRLCELHLVMDKINEYYSKKINYSTYSIHVIL